jgi:hypothetical protein
MSRKSCESCMMPLDEGHGQANREDVRYCTHCFHDGKLCYEGNDLKEFQRRSFDAMRSQGMGKCKAWFFTALIRFAPRWKK